MPARETPATINRLIPPSRGMVQGGGQQGGGPIGGPGGGPAAFEINTQERNIAKKRITGNIFFNMLFTIYETNVKKIDS